MDRPSLSVVINKLYQVKDLKTGEAYSEKFLRHADAALHFVIDLDLLSLKDLYHASSVCKGWFVLVRQKIKDIGLKQQNVNKQASKVVEWKKALAQRHSMQYTHLVQPTTQNVVSAASASSSEILMALSRTLGKSNQTTQQRKDLPTRKYTQELAELRGMLEEQKQRNAEMQKFKKKYDQYASKYLQTAMNSPKYKTTSNLIFSKRKEPQSSCSNIQL